MTNPSPAAIEAANIICDCIDGSTREAHEGIAEIIQQAIDKAQEWQPQHTMPTKEGH